MNDFERAPVILLLDGAARN